MLLSDEQSQNMLPGSSVSLLERVILFRAVQFEKAASPTASTLSGITIFSKNGLSKNAPDGMYCTESGIVKSVRFFPIGNISRIVSSFE